MIKRGLLLTTVVALAAPATAQVSIVQPGVPGSVSRVITPAEASRIANTSFTADDVTFMQMMIVHHEQAVTMASLAAARTNHPQLLSVAGRITASQKDEARFMRDWLTQRRQPVDLSAAAHAAMNHAAMGHSMPGQSGPSMKGMASPAQLAALAAAKGDAFNRLFLDLMIAHHKGAVDMVEELTHRGGTAADPILYQFVNDVSNEQTAEIDKMDTLRASFVGDPRVDLKPGYANAGQAILNLEKIASLPRPAGFFDPANPAGLPPPKAQKPARKGGAPRPGNPAAKDAEWSDRGPLLSFAQTDMAFEGDRLFVGNYHGFNVYRLAANGVPVQVSSVVCPGGQGDVSVIGNLLLMSVEQGRGRRDCGLQGIPQDISNDRFRGLRIFDISDIGRPRQVGQVQTCRGSHTHSIVKGPEGDGRILVYNSGTAGVRKTEELASCIGDVAGDVRTALFRIDIIEIPVANPAAARIIASPAVFADEKTGSLAGLGKGGKLVDDGQETSVTNQCHDITVFPTRKLAAGACSGNGIIFDIADPRKPRRIDVVSDPGFAYWHSATFNNDGTKVLFTDEWGGGGRPRCRSFDRRDWGADAIYDIQNGRLVRKGTYKLTAPQTEQENCVAHNGSIIPVPGRDIMVQAWYQGGLSIFDYTNSAAPSEIAYFDRGPVDAKRPSLAGYWSAYYYRGRIYGTEIARGLDVFSLKPSAQLSANEIAAAALATTGQAFNPQQQYPVRWPAEPVVARAYMDQLRRAGQLDQAVDARLGAALAQAQPQLDARAKARPLAAELRALAGAVKSAPNEAARRDALSDVLKELADRLS
jgi:uncharacterized protein (DUF305 family)